MQPTPGSEESKTMSNTFQCLVKPENTLFIVQVVAILVIVIAAVVNLSLHTGNVELWTMILTSSIGYLMPNPQFKTSLSEKVKDGDDKSHTSL